MPIILIASVALSTLMTIAGVLHFNAFPANHVSDPLLGAASTTFQRTMLPIDSTENLGTTTRPWDELHVNEICLTADCKTAWPTAGGGGSFPFTAATTWGTTTYATGTPSLWFKYGMYASSTSQFDYASATALSATNLYGALTGNADTATALAANGSNCSAGSFPLGVDASGAVETCTDAWTEAENTSAAYLSTVDMSANTNLAATLPVILTGDTLSLANIYPFQGVGNSTTTLTRFFGGASTTDLTANTLKVGGTATTSISVAGAVTIPSGLTVSDLTSALILTGSGGLMAEYTGIDCTNQFVRDVSALGAGTCATVDISSDTNLTAGDALTITGDDIDFDGGTAPSGELGGTWGSITIDDSLTVAGWTLTTATISATNATTTGTQYVGSHQVPAFGETSWTYGSSTQGSGTTTKSAYKIMSKPGSFTTVQCNFNNFMRVLAYDVSGNRMNDFIASSTVGTVQLTTNDTFTAGEAILFDVGTTTAIGSLVEGGCTFQYTNN